MESRYYALTHMSDENMMRAESRNQQLSQKHDKDMKRIQNHENYLKEESSRAIKALRDDFTAMLAYQYVYKSTNLKNVEKAKEKAASAKRKRPMSDKYDLLEGERRAASSKAPRPLGSLRELEKYRDELKVKFPPVDNKTDNKERPNVIMLGEKHYESRTTSRNTNDTIRSTAFPKIEDAMGVGIKYRNKTDKGSFFSAPGDIDCETGSEFRVESRTSITEFDMGQNLVMMRKKEQEKLERRRILPLTPTPAQNAQTKTDRECKRRKLPSLPPRSPNLYPKGVKNAHGMHNFIRREATDIIEFWSQDSKRLEDFEKSKSLGKPDPLMFRSQTTTEMLRELNQHKKQEQQFREQVDAQSMVVRQLTPKPRPLSPISTRMTEYSSRISSPQPRESSPSFKHKREGSEKIPSVSRTSSYKELPDGPIELHENALLTAAERIEKERLEKENTILQRKIRMAQISIREMEQNEMKNKDKTRPPGKSKELPLIKKKRLLPQTTWSQDASATVDSKDIKTEKRSTLSEKNDLETIDAVSKANAIKEEVLREYERRLLGKPKLQSISKTQDQSDKQYWKMAESLDAGRKSFNSERDAYTPLSRSTGPIKRRLTPITDAVVSDQFSHQSLPGNPALGKLGKKMPFSYDKFSRAPPDAKKRLELRAKNKKKAQQHNAKIEEEKENDVKANATRPSTRVSFNEKVTVVFQTI